ncbi:MAG TPA: nucleoside hydrolase-like domain-containing protein, partial [Desulfosporosinus sp.]|nr:nucleoside hydrolase-like domain-containing protein [Desulfosporosinus sp.]
MKTFNILVSALLIFLCIPEMHSCSAKIPSQVQTVEIETNKKPRVIATTDGEIDDRCSMVRFLLYANEWDLEGIIHSSSKFHWVGHDWDGVDWLKRDIDLYAQVYDNLKQHDPSFPSPEQLKDLTYIGNIDNVGEMGKDT